jgi:hypothetical protein
MAQIIAKPIASVDEVPEAETVYCIKHEQMVKVLGLGHEANDGRFCTFPDGYAYTEPNDPVEDQEWSEVIAQSVSDEEREQAELGEVGFWLGGAE